jgi:hypothetical protein
MKGLGISEEQMKALYILDSRGPEWNALRHFLRNPWFRRVWIVQEAAFAKEVHLLYGIVCMDWEYVSRGLAILNDRHLLEVLRPWDTSSCFSDSFRDSIVGLGNIDTMLEFRSDVNYKRKFDLTMVLKTCIGFESSDPRDKVYAVLGLTTDNSKSVIKPRYNKDNPARTVYTNAMRFILIEGASPLDALSGAGIGFDRSMNDLPSWVPDWNHNTHIQILDM